MNLHVSWAVNCKTARCPATIVLKYIGVHDGRSIYLLPADTFETLVFQCGVCGKAHTYTKQDLIVHQDDNPPPPEFVDRF
jgi:hypothetical protein